MKKFYLLLAALFITSMTFSQGIMAPKQIKDAQYGIQFGNSPSKTTPEQLKNGNGSFWFSFTDALESSWGVELDGFGPPTQCDSLGLFAFTDGNAPCQFMSHGQVFDFTHESWNSFYYDNEAYIGMDIPAIGSDNTGSYSLDSLQLCFRYERGTNVAADVVDTIMIAYVINMDGESAHTLSSGGVPAFSMYYIPYDENTFTAAYASPDNSVTLESPATTIIYDKITLSAEDGQTDEEGYFYYYSFPTPEGLDNITGKVMGVTFTFIPGNARNTTSVIGTDVDLFRTILMDDPRPEYQYPWGTQELINDLNTGLFTDAGNFDPASGWYGVYNPNGFWNGCPHVYMGLHISCNDCAMISVEDMEEQNISVRPNPATNNITLDLAGEGNAQVEIFNLVGQSVYNEMVNATSTTINVSNFNTGVYMLKVTQNGKVYTTKVVVR